MTYDQDFAVSTSALTKEYSPGVGIIDVDLAVPRGVIYGFLGPNGAGKSTTLRMLTGIARPTNGTAEVLGLDPFVDAHRLKARTGVLGSETTYPRHHSGRSLLAMIANLRRAPSVVKHGRCIASELDLDLDRKAHQLSLGNRQKLGLVLALAHKPELVILDEPSNGLDPLMQRTVDGILRRLADGGTTVLLSSHSLTQVERIADHVGFVRHGRLLRQGELDQLGLDRRHQASLTFDRPVDIGRFSSLGKNVSATGDGRDIRVRWSGPAAPVLAVAAELGVVALETGEAPLEDYFLDMYDTTHALEGNPNR